MGIPLGPFRNFAQIHHDIHTFEFILGVTDTGIRLLTGVNGTGNKLSVVYVVVIGNNIASVVVDWLRLVSDFHRFRDTVDKYIAGNNDTGNN